MGDRNAVFQKRAEQTSERGQRKRIGVDRLHKSGGVFLQRFDQRADFIRAKQVLRTIAQNLVQMRCDDRAGVDGKEALGNRLIARGRINPQRRTAEAGIARLFAFQGVAAVCLAGIDRKNAMGLDHRAAKRNSAQQDAIFIRRHFKRVTHAELRHDEAECLAELLSHAGDARNQRRTAPLIHQLDKAVAQLDRDKRMIGHVFQRDA